MIQKFRYIFSRADKFKLVGLVVLMIIGSVLELLAVAVFNPFIEVMMQTSSIADDSFLQFFFQHTNIDSVEGYLIALSFIIAVIYVVKNVYLTFEQNAILSFSYRTRMNLATRLLTTYMNEPYTFHLSKNIAEMQRCLQTDTSQFMSLINSCLQLAVEFVTCLALGGYLFHTSHSITVLIGLLLGLCVFIFFIISKKVSSKLGRQNEFYNAKLFQWINQSLGGIKEVKILQREKYFIDSYRTNYKKVIWGARVNELLAAVPKYIVETVAIVGLVLAIIVKLLFGHGALETFVPQMAVFAVAAFRLLPSVGKINAYVNNVMYTKASLDMIYQDLCEIEKNKPIEVEWEGKTENWKFMKGVFAEHITYHYPDSDTEVLHDITLEIPKGKTVALIGPSGAGKTTLADIILGLLPPVSGVVRMDDKNIYENLRSWRQKLGYIPQSIYLSDDTIRNNVAFGIYEDQIDDDAIWKALEKAQLKDFVQGLEKGLDTYVGDRGVRLSGGQRQRIGIARALYHDPEILVLDEATSALDSGTEQAVMESIESLQGLKTMVIIAHRLTTIKNADLIYEGYTMKYIAGIVLYNPDLGRLKENIESICKQVDKVILIDNGSDNIREIEDLIKEYLNCILLKNGENMGIAYALNQILKYAYENDVKWFLTLDQDSVCSRNLINTYSKYIEIPGVAIITSCIKDRNYELKDSFRENEEYRFVTYCITSGALMNTEICERCGGWDNKLFIDNVDGDICINLKKRGYKVLSLHYNGLLHEVGHGKNVKFLWKKDIVYNHPAMRQYYMARNQIYVARKYPEEFSMYKQLKKELKKIWLVILFEENKWEKCKARIRGVKDGFRLDIKKENNK